ncbi:MAG TPA: prephenate dehydrogenase/arogenate dehydrogenase family protein [Acidimicrobiales bacterium]|nr:prephenate dehydrogenase/arogenate dehydrogenase family protein [Acidimicrobiales bacterium]
MALRARNWHVTGTDRDPARAARAVELGALDAVGDDPTAEITFVATPVATIVEAACAVLDGGTGVVTDVGGVKASVVGEVGHPRFVGGHPMAGSEQEGVEGADPALFQGATWVLTPTLDTDAEAYTTVRSVVRELGAEVVALPPDRHDALVALVSHVPHLAAATLMTIAAEGAEEHAAVLRLAAGGFRDMTRVAAGHPGIWLDICAENRDAIVDGLDRLVEALTAMRTRVAGGERADLEAALERARHARLNLPRHLEHPEEMVELQVPVPDRPGVIAEITTLLAELDVNVEDLDLTHSPEGPKGVLVLVIRADADEPVRRALLARGYRPSSRPL